MKSKWAKILGVVGGISILGGGASIISLSLTDKIHFGDINYYNTPADKDAPVTEPEIISEKPIKSENSKKPINTTPAAARPETNKPVIEENITPTIVETPAKPRSASTTVNMDNMGASDLVKLGIDFYTKNQISQAVTTFNKALAKENHPNAYYYLGLIHGKDTGGSNSYKNYNKAASYYQKAAQNKHSDAAYELALLHFYGYGVPKDKNGEAKKWLQIAADLGCTTASTFLKRNY